MPAGSRPGAAPLAPEVEHSRVVPVIAALAEAGLVVSADTRNAAVMAAALDAGARIIYVTGRKTWTRNESLEVLGDNAQVKIRLATGRKTFEDFGSAQDFLDEAIDALAFVPGQRYVHN